MKKPIIGLLLCIGLAGRAWAVETAEQLTFDALFTGIYRDCTAEVSCAELRAFLWACYQAPLALNQTPRSVLACLGVLSEAQLDAFFRHLAKNGPLLAIYELQAIPGFDMLTIQRLVPFVTVEAVRAASCYPSLWGTGLGARNSYGLVRYGRTLPTRRGYLYDEKRGEVPYAGSPAGYTTRLIIKEPSGWGLGLVARKGAGEALAWDYATQRYGVPVGRLYWMLRHRKCLKALVVGDYAVGYGQGLVLNAGFCMNKGSEAIKVIRTNNVGIRPHKTLTSAAFRGVAATWQWGRLGFTAYCSRVALDGTLKEGLASGGQYVQSVSRGGYYRTASEMARKGQVNEQVVGGTFIYKGPTRGALVGMNVLYGHYSLPIYPDTRRGNPLRFSGQDHANGSLFYRYLWQNFHFFGEGALSKNGGKAGVLGVVTSLGRYVDSTVLWRHYDQAFHGPFGKGFKERTADNSNEQGLYLGARVRPWQRLYLDASYDYFYFPWLLGQASAGRSWLGKATYEPSRTSLLCLQCKTTAKMGRVAGKGMLKAAMGTKNNYKLRYKYALGRAVSLGSEVQCSSYQQLGGRTWGYAAVQDAAYRVRRWQLKGRVAWFCTDAWVNRLTFYEPNVLYSGFNFRAYYGYGMRYCLLVVYKPVPAFRLALKCALTHYWDRDKVGSGQEAVAGNRQWDVGLQGVFRF